MVLLQEATQQNDEANSVEVNAITTVNFQVLGQTLGNKIAMQCHGCPANKNVGGSPRISQVDIRRI